MRRAFSFNAPQWPPWGWPDAWCVDLAAVLPEELLGGGVEPAVLLPFDALLSEEALPLLDGGVLPLLGAVPVVLPDEDGGELPDALLLVVPDELLDVELFVVLLEFDAGAALVDAESSSSRPPSCLS